MQLPAETAVKRFEDAALGSLLVGRFREKDPNFFAVRTELQTGTGQPTPYMAILSSWVDDQDGPYLCDPAVGETLVLDLGRGWSFDVSIDESAPAFTDDPSRILIRSDTEFYIRLPKEGLYLDLARGNSIANLPVGLHQAYWSEFAIYLSQPGMDGPGATIFSWPKK